MGYELVPRADRALERAHARELEMVHRSAKLADAEIGAIGTVTRRALREAFEVNMVRAYEERMDPDGAEQYSFIAATGVTQMAHVIARMGGEL